MSISAINDPNQQNPAKAISVFYCGHEKCEADHSFGPAVRVHHLFHYIITGKGRLYIDNHCYHLQAGQGFLICPHLSTYYIADSEEPWEYVWVGFDGYDVKTILHNCGLSEKHPIFTDQNSEIGTVLLELLAMHQSSPRQYQVLSHFYRFIACMEQPKNNQHQDADYFEQATRFIYDNYSYPIKITDIAQHIGIDRTYLYKVFIAKTELSPQQYLIRYRLTAACQLLTQSRLNITEIAFSCGFKDSPSFCKQFKTRYQITPMAYRKNPTTIL